MMAQAFQIVALGDRAHALAAETIYTPVYPPFSAIGAVLTVPAALDRPNPEALHTARGRRSAPFFMEPSRRYENQVVLILFFTWGTVFLDRMSQLYLAPYFAPEFHLSSQQIGFLASVVSVTWALSGLLFGALSDHCGRRVILIPGVLMFSALSWLSGVAHSFEQLLLIRALMGAAEGPCWAVINAITEESSGPSRRGRYVALVVSAGALVGLCAAPILTTQVASQWGWRWGFFVTGVPGMIMAMLIWKFVREPKRAEEEGQEYHRPTLGG